MLADAFSQNTEVKEELTQEEISKVEEQNDEDDAFDAFDEAADIRQSTRNERIDNVNDLINAAKPEDKEFLLQKINSGEISVKCN